MMKRDDDKQIRLKLMRELKSIYDNKDFVCGVICIAGSRRIWQELLNYIYFAQEGGEEVSSDNIQLLALALRRESDEKKLRAALEKIPDSYEDFVIGIIGIAEKYAETGQVMDYLQSHLNARTSDIIGYVFSGKTESMSQSIPGKKRMTAAMMQLNR
ncbi:MAG: hypothetical protein IJ682_04275 [Lachnospiraceae bacterium]|nr:hypothetical protein [Lachnospiraceae bacterium]